VRCVKCGSNNSENSPYCNQCATPLTQQCRKCLFANALDAKFCSQCSASLDAAERTPDTVHSPALWAVSGGI
jgi:hypothetical protein